MKYLNEQYLQSRHFNHNTYHTTGTARQSIAFSHIVMFYSKLIRTKQDIFYVHQMGKNQAQRIKECNKCQNIPEVGVGGFLHVSYNAVTLQGFVTIPFICGYHTITS